MPTIYDFTLPRILLKQRAPKIDTVPDKICPKFNDLLSMFWQIFVCSAKSAKDNNKKAANNYLISRKKSATILVCLCFCNIIAISFQMVKNTIIGETGQILLESQLKWMTTFTIMGEIYSIDSRFIWELFVTFTITHLL